MGVLNPIDPSRFNNKLPCSPDDPAKWEKYGCRRFDNFTFFSLHILTLQVIFPEKIIELCTRWYKH